MKTCPKCYKLKLLHGYHKDRTRKDGYCCYCKACTKKHSKEYNARPEIVERHQAYHIKHRDRINAYVKDWQKRNRKKCREYNRTTYAKRKEKMLASVI